MASVADFFKPRQELVAARKRRETQAAAAATAAAACPPADTTAPEPASTAAETADAPVSSSQPEVLAKQAPSSPAARAGQKRARASSPLKQVAKAVISSSSDDDAASSVANDDSDADGAEGGSAGDDGESPAAAAVPRVHGGYHPVEDGGWAVGAPMPYRALTGVFSAIEAESKRLVIQRLLCDLFRSVIACSPWDLLPTVYLCVNRLAPAYEGVELGIGDGLLIKAIAEATGRQAKDVRQDLTTIADLGLVAESSRSHQKTLGFMAKPAPLTVAAVFEAFQQIAAASGKASQERKTGTIKRLLVKASGPHAEPRFIVRGLQGKLRIGLAEKTVLVALSQAITITPPVSCELPEQPRTLSSEWPAPTGEHGTYAAKLDTRLSDAGRLRGSEVCAKELAEAEETLKQVFSELPTYNQIIPALLCGGTSAAREACALTPGFPVAPMLAKPTKGVSEVLTRLAGQAFTCEWKYDGERAQVHKLPTTGEHCIFSRNSENTTGKYPDLAAILGDAENSEGNTGTGPATTLAHEVAAVTGAEAAEGAAGSLVELAQLNELATKAGFEPLDLSAFQAPSGQLDSYIMDGEVVAYDREAGKLLPFQQLSSRARKDVTADNVKVQVIYAAFDLIYLNGQSLLNLPLAYRRALLHHYFKPVPGKFTFAVGHDVLSGDTEELAGYVDEAVAGMCEGLMVKTLLDAATYEPSKRSLNWLKLKKDYMEGATDSLDLVPIGAFYGKGKRSGTYGVYLMAAWDDDEEEYTSVTKVGTGFSDTDLLELKTYFHEHNLVSADKPSNVVSTMTPDVWLLPQAVWEVRAADLSLSPVYTAAAGMADPDKGIALRFPRFLRARDDKSAEQATNTQQVFDMYCSQPAIANGTA